MKTLKSRQAILYRRFSTGSQSKGDSLKRQSESYQTALAITGATDSGLSYTDEGKSGYKGDHNKEGGKLYQLIIDLEQRNLNLTEKPVIFVEKVDRLGRMEIDPMQDLFRRLLAVADIHISDDYKTHTQSNRTDIGSYIMLAIQNHQAWEESDKKSKRVRAAKKSALEDTIKSGKLLGGRLYPNWLTTNSDKTQYIVIPERAKSINLIFELYISGLSIRAIAVYLNNENIPSWDNKGNDSKQWISGTIRTHLKSVATIGTFRSRQYKDDWSRSETVNDPDALQIPNHFPPIVQLEVFKLVQSMITKHTQ